MKKFFIFVVISYLLLVICSPVLAVDCTPPDCQKCQTTAAEAQCRHETLFQQSGYATTSTTATFPARIGVTVNVVMSVTGIVFLAIVVFSGIQWMTAGGNEEMVKKSRTRIERAVIGLIVVVGSWAIVNFVLGSLLFPGQGGWSFFTGNSKAFFGISL